MRRGNPSVAFAAALLLTATGAGVGLTSSHAAPPAAFDCVPFLDVTINGGDPQSVAPPEGSTPADALDVAVEAGLAGADCEARLNSPPLLLGAWVDPNMTGVGSSFRYQVHYVDVDNDPPSSITATLDNGVARAMTPADPGDTDYRDGALYEAWFGVEFVGDVIVPDALRGDRWARIEASDGVHAAEPVVVHGPRLHDVYAGSLVAPNPVNRLVIHPVANGPTLTPPSEVPPPAGTVAPEGDGFYSHFFPIDPTAGERGARWSVGTGAVLRLGGFGLLEGEPGPESGFELHGQAVTDPRAHVGNQAVDLTPIGPTAPSGVVRVFPESDTYRFALIGAARFYVNATTMDASTTVPVGIWIELDADGDGQPDHCVGRVLDVEASAEWTPVLLTRTTPVELRSGGCSTDTMPPGAAGQATLDDLQDDPLLGLLPVTALRVEAAGSSVGSTTLVDSLALIPGPPNTMGDVDACVYGPAHDVPGSPLQPIACVSDIGPNSAPVPAGATHASVWADQMAPVISADAPVPARPYLEPLAFSFTYAERRPDGPAFEPPQPPAARIWLAGGTDADGGPDDGSEPLWDSGALPVGDLHRIEFSLPFLVPDGIHHYALVFDTGLGGEPFVVALAVQRFVNDPPSAALDATTTFIRRTAVFHLAAHDADDGQSETARRLGGLTAWSLAFGDGSSVTGGFPMPDVVEHRYAKPGLYEARLVVEDAQGLEAESSVQVDFRPGR